MSETTSPSPPRILDLGRRDYESVWRAMQRFTDQRRGSGRADEIWLLEHHPVFTLGQAGKPEHLLNPGHIPVIRSDRGGQVTYHGPGQLVLYLLLDLRRLRLGIRQMVSRMEQSVIDLLADYGIEGTARPHAPGVYVGERKIAALGLRVRHGCSFHGLSLNVNMDLSPFSRINPCGYPGLLPTQLYDLGGPDDIHQAAHPLLGHLLGRLGYNRSATDIERKWESHGETEQL